MHPADKRAFTIIGIRLRSLAAQMDQKIPQHIGITFSHTSLAVCFTLACSIYILPEIRHNTVVDKYSGKNYYVQYIVYAASPVHILSLSTILAELDS